MSIKIASQENYKGKEIKLEIDIPDTLVLEDHSSECVKIGCSSLRTFPFSLVLRDKTIQGDLIIHKEPKETIYYSNIEVTIALFEVDNFIIKPRFDVTNLLNDEKVKFRSKSFSNQSLINIVKSAKYKKLPKDVLRSQSNLFETFYKDELSNPNPIFALKGSITLWIDFAKDSEGETISKLKNFKSLISEQAFAQVDKNFTIICQGEKFHFNKILLSLVSEVFAKMVQGPFNKEATSNTAEIVDFSPDTIRTFQKFAFEDQEIKDEDVNVELLMFAQKYLMTPLVTKCKEQLLATITHGNVFDIIKTAYFLDDENMFKIASEYIKVNSNDLEDTDEWLSLEETNPKIMIKVLKHMFLGKKTKGKKLKK